MINWSDGVGDEGSGNYLIGRSSTTSSTKHSYTDKDSFSHSHHHDVTIHSNAENASAGDNVPEYVGLLKLIRIY